MVAASAALHVLVLLALLIALKREKPWEEPLPPPAISVIFQGGAPEAPSQPNPNPESDNAKPAPGPMPEQRPAPEVTPPSPPPQAMLQPQPETPPQPEAPPQPETQPEQPPPVTPPRPAPPRVELYVPRPPEGSAPFQVPELPPPPPPPPRPAPPRPRASPRSEFTPTFREWSLGRPPASAERGLGPKVAGPSRAAPQIQGAERLGTDWANELSAWVEAHKYYPQQAILNGEDGSPEVEVTVRRDGTVQAVELDTRSGSQWLDIALQGLFRGAHLPPFPDTTRDQQLTFHFTMHYVLVRR